MSTDLFGNRALVDSGDRSAFDWYPTPGWATRSLVYHVPEIAGSTVLECASGDGAIASLLADEFGCNVITNDIDQGHPAHIHMDAAGDAFWLQHVVGQSLDWVITNPPFNVAFEMLTRARKFANVAFLLRKTFLEPTEDRGPWLHANPPSRIIGLPRHSFRGDGSDSVSCDWMIWERHPQNYVYPIEIDYLAKSRTKGSV